MTGEPAEPPLIFIVAGEPSGDHLAARLMAALKDATSGRVRFAGVGGVEMQRQGLTSLFPIDELAVMGLLEVVPHLPRLVSRINMTARTVRQMHPDALVTVDSPDFTLAVSKRVKGSGIPLIHYVAPSVWAWKPWRARRIAGILDHLLTLLPFEPPYFERHGLASTFVGHPAVEDMSLAESLGPDFRERHGVPRDATLLCLLPGSRRGEVNRHLPLFAETVKRLQPAVDGLRLVLPTVSTVEELVEATTADWPVSPLVVRGDDERRGAFAASDVALAASGTVAVELAAAKVPTVITYRVNWLTAHIAKRIIRVPYASIPNLLMGHEVQPERLQWDATPERLVADVLRLLQDADARGRQLTDCEEVIRQLKPEGALPSAKAAAAVLGVIARKSREPTGEPERSDGD